MQVTNFYKTILGIEDPWEISKVEIDKVDKSVHIYLSHSTGSQFCCKDCNKLCSVHDHGKTRTWRHLDTCDHYTYLHASLPRLDCSECGVLTVVPSWANPNSRFTLLFESYAIDVLQLTMVVSKVSKQLRITEDQLKGIRNRALNRALTHRTLSGRLQKTDHLCIDEKSHKKGHNYLSIIYDGATGKVLEIVEDRTEQAATLAFVKLSQHIDLQSVNVVTMDMWQAFKNATEQIIPQADIVHDRFHLSKYLNNAVDITRRAENKQLVKEEDERLKKTKYLWLKNPDNLTEAQQIHHQHLLEDGELKTVKAWKLKEDFRNFFKAENQNQATLFFNDWFDKVNELDNKPLIKVAKTFQNHIEQLVTYAKHKVSNAMAECVNTTIQQIKINARGFRSPKAFANAILFYLGGLDLYP